MNDIKLLRVFATISVLAFSCAFVAVSADKPDAATTTRITQAITTVHPGAKITNVGKETEDGIEFYEVAFDFNGKSLEGDVTAEGVLLNTEETAELRTFPAAAATALKKLTKGLKVKTTEISRKYARAEKDKSTGAVKVTKFPLPIVAYEAEVTKGGRSGEFAVSADGTVIERPKWAKGEEKEKE